MNLLALKVKRGQRVEAEHHNGLVDIAAQVAVQYGSLKGRRMPDGFTPDVRSVSVSRPPHAWRVSWLLNDRSELEVTVSPGTVRGIVPTIDGIALDDVTEEGLPPVLIVPGSDWAKVGRTERMTLMAHYQMEKTSFAVTAVKIVALAKVPQLAGWEWYKLLGWFVRYQGEVKYYPQAFFPQNFMALDQRANGRFTPLPFLA